MADQSIIEQVLGGNSRLCEECGEPFIQFHQRGEQLRCPTCQDTRQGRPSVVQDREFLAIYDGVQIVSLPPGSWHEFQATSKDEARYRMDVSGAMYGAAWSGRIVLWSEQPVQTGEVVRLRHMQSTHQVKAVYEARVRNDFDTGQIVGYSAREVIPVTEEHESARIETEQHEYIVFEPSLVAPQWRLEWASAYSKRTLKGFGKQVDSRIVGPEPEWLVEVSGGVRSGRTHTVGRLALFPHGAEGMSVKFESWRAAPEIARRQGATTEELEAVIREWQS